MRYKRHMLRIPILLPLLSVPAAVLAQVADPVAVERRANAEDGRATISGVWENDKFGGSDRQYTNGFRLNWLSSTGTPPEFTRDLRAALAPVLSSDGALRVGLAIGQNMYTPDDTQLIRPDPTDRPYAGWTYFAGSLVTDTGSRLDTIELSVGILGPSAKGEEVQNAVHQLISVDTSKGWDSQLRDEPGVNLLWERRWRFAPEPLVSDFNVDFSPNVAVSVGNIFTYASVGGVVRIGQDLQADWGAPRIRPALAGSGYFQPNSGFSWYLFAGVEGRGVLRDATLDGNSFRSGPSVDKDAFVADFQAGIAVAVESVRVAFHYDIRTREFEGQGPVRFGGVSVSIRY